MKDKQASETMNSLIRSYGGRRPSAEEVHGAVRGQGGNIPPRPAQPAESALEQLALERGATFPRYVAQLVGDAEDQDAAIERVRAEAPELFQPVERPRVGSVNAGAGAGQHGLPPVFDVGEMIRRHQAGG